MKHNYDQSQRQQEFQVGDKVMLHLQPYRQSSVAKRKGQKLSAKFYGPFVVLEQIGSTAYKLDLPAHSKLHPIFHVSTLKWYHKGQDSCTPMLPPTPPDVPLQPLAVLDQRIMAGQLEILVHWWAVLDQRWTT